jgi:hypothetical protein
MHRRTVIWFIPLLVGASALGAPDDSKAQGKEDKSSPEAQFKAIMEEYKQAQTELGKAHRAAKTAQEKQKIEEQLRKKPQEYAGRLLTLAQKNPKAEVAFDALVFIVANSEGGTEADKAADLLLQNHVKKLGDLFGELATTDSPAVEKLLRGAMTQSADKRLKGQATLGLAQFFKNKSEATPKGDPKAAKEAENLFDQVVKDHAGQNDLVQEAKDQLFILRNLAIGKVAPDIDGEDGDGKKFKLNDYRGKVVVLDFWAGW